MSLYPDKLFGKTKIVNKHGQFTQVVFIKYERGYIVDIGDPDGDGNEDGYEIGGWWWNLDKYPNGVPYTINPSRAVRLIWS